MSVRSRWIAIRKKRREALAKAQAELKKLQADIDAAQRVVDRHPKPLSPRATALNFAKAQLGTKEQPPGSNRGPKIDQWQQAVGMLGQPWCGAFVGACLSKAGVKINARIRYCPYIIEDAKAGRNGFVKVVPFAERQSGDVFVYDWQGDGIADHTGIYTGSDLNGLCLVIEGNTAVGNDSNGGEVMQRERDRKFIVAVCRPAWPSS